MDTSQGSLALISHCVLRRGGANEGSGGLRKSTSRSPREPDAVDMPGSVAIAAYASVAGGIRLSEVDQVKSGFDMKLMLHLRESGKKQWHVTTPVFCHQTGSKPR
jgi:hypothetical protein